MDSKINQNWNELWLSYESRKSCGNDKYTGRVMLCGFNKEHAVIRNALKELEKSVSGMLAINVVPVEEDLFTAGLKILRNEEPGSTCATNLQNAAEAVTINGSYKIWESSGVLTLEADDENGVLYGIYHILRWIGMERSLKSLDVACIPDNPLRMLNHWDNMDGSIERGYSGKSFFFDDNNFYEWLPRQVH